MAIIVHRKRSFHKRPADLQVAQALAAADLMVSVGIVGAGFSGLCLAIQLQKAGLKNFTIFEAADDIGGTWRANRYPGCACDVQSVMYCYSFEPYPWTKHYAEQEEILQYLHHCADKYKLWDNIRLNTRITGAEFDEDRAMWRLRTAIGEQHEVSVLVLAQGPLSIPTIPSTPGLSGFSGSIMHTAAWDSSINLQGKKVAVVGTGASAVQLTPKLQQVARELVVFQRTPAWVLPRRELMPRYAAPAAQHGNRLTLWLQRQAVFWRQELLLGTALAGNKKPLLKKVESLAMKHLKAAVKDPLFQQQLTPSYRVGCKRILTSDDYYTALAQPNVRLVASGLKQVDADSTTLRADNGDVVTDVDVIIWATGFDLRAPLAQFDIRARGLELNKTLEAKPESYYGLAVAGFPNLFTLLGLNTALGHHSVVFMAECQAKLIVRLLRSQMLIKGHSFLEVLPAAQDKFNRELQQRLQRTVWLVPGCKSWYLSGFKAAPENPASGTTSSAAGSGGSAVMWPGLCAEFWWRTRRPIEQDWRVGSHAQVSAAGAVSSAHCSSNGGPEVATKETAQHKLMPIATVFVTDEPGEHCSE